MRSLSNPCVAAALLLAAATVQADLLIENVTLIDGTGRAPVAGVNVLVEKVFAWPGVGSYALEALIASDYAPVQGFVLAMALMYLLLNLSVDLVNTLLDPRLEKSS